MAGIHLLDEASGTYNVPYIRRLLSGYPVVLVNMVYRQQGLIVARGNPKEINSINDLVRDDIRFINRQNGAGTRILLDYKLQEARISPDLIQGYDREEYTHMAVAAGVASGAADAAMGILAAANALRLDFIPVAEERYDLCIPAEFYNTPIVQRVLNVLKNPDFHLEVERLGGYSTRDCGKILWSQE